MAIYVANLSVNQGANFYQTFNLSNSIGDSSFDLTGYSIDARMKKHAAAVGFTSFTSTVENTSNGTISLSLTSAQTAALKPGRYVYDIVITSSGGFKSRAIEGNVLVREGVTV